MAEHKLDIEINIGAGQISGAVTAEKALSDVKGAAEAAGKSIDNFTQPSKVVDTTEFKNLAAAVGETGQAAETYSVSLNNFKEAAGGITLAARGGPTAIIGLSRAIEGIGKAAGVSAEALASLTSKLGAIGAGFAVGTAIGDSIYKNIVTPIWDAIDAYNKLNDPVAKAYEETKKLNREILATRSLKLTEVVAEINGVRSTLIESAKQAAETKKALDTLASARSSLEQAKVKNAEASGKLTEIEAKALIAEIKYQKELTDLVHARFVEIQKLAEIEKASGKKSPEYRDQQAQVAAASTNVETAQVNRQTELIGIGGELKKVIQDLDASIKAQSAKVAEARSAVEPARQSGSNAALQSALAEVQKQEQLLNSMTAQMSRIQSTMGEAAKTFQASVESTGQDVGSALGSAGTTIKTAGTEFVAAADGVKKDVETAGQAATAAVSGSTGSVAASIAKMGQDVSGAVNIMGTQIVSTTQALLAKVNSLSAEIQSVGAVANAARVESSLNSSQIKNMR